MKKHIFDKVSLKNTENISSQNFSNYYTVNISNDINNNLEINNNSDDNIFESSEIEGIKYCREEEKKITQNTRGENTKVDQLPIFPNLSE